MAHVHHHHAHGHGHGDDDEITVGAVRTALTVAVILAALATIVGLVVWWPTGDSVVDRSELRELLGYGDRERARVTSTTEQPCSFAPTEDCVLVGFEITSGDDRGATGELEHQTGPTPAGSLGTGDRILVNDVGEGPPGAGPEWQRYSFADMERGQALWFVALIFVGAVVALGRWRGLLALSGLAVSFAVILLFIFPAFLHGSDPIGVAITGASVIAFATLYLAHGFNLRTTVALLGTFASLALIAGLAFVTVNLANLFGLADDEALSLLAFGPDLNFRGLLLAAMIIGALGVLDDVTVTQTAAVWELNRASPDLGARALYSAGVRIGRDHIAATVNTLVLAYTAAALPMLLLISQSGISLGEMLSNEGIAVEIVQTLVGSTGLVAAVPLTTGLAAFVVTRGGPPVEVAGPDPGVPAAPPGPPPPSPRPPYDLSTPPPRPAPPPGDAGWWNQ